ncbi:D-inositol-3-phosphate glycosyltransferase [wastewater metagenome]|uniref:D-inositol-3-phosphate glycosyltransferase n=2 Tax=unclassified sequences TaxID=12908 RepID=A0A5B8R654_9ZZZZ|nr:MULTISPECIES: glycosyltransferase [Arhodomonas]MCS4504133.1 glycosyltransferase [Arhodomonas aquaeolei]QEA03931.1 D-inositol-3-phosphate glycosyltransferase [uncultured organism]
MNILMMTNTYLPHVGGVARSVDSFAQMYRARGHRVMVVAPEFDDAPRDETDVVRIPALQNFNGSDFSVVLPVPRFLERAVMRFEPDIVHSHHPFLIGSTALRLASLFDLPLVFTHHTMYERYTHYVPGDSAVLRRFVVQLSTSYANLCDRVFAPSESIAGILAARGVHTPIDVVPTGVDLAAFRGGDGASFRRRLGIDADAFVIGHVGRLAHEKNLGFLARAVARVLADAPHAHCVIVGAGAAEDDIRSACERAGVAARLHMTGKLVQPELADAYAAMDLFAFASLTETQGVVLAEAMAAGLPVVAIDAPGSREVVRDGENGRLLRDPDETAFAAAIEDAMARREAGWDDWQAAVAETARAYSLQACADRALALYRDLDGTEGQADEDHDLWHMSLRRIRAEWDLLKGVAQAAGTSLGDEFRNRRDQRDTG